MPLTPPSALCRPARPSLPAVVAALILAMVVAPVVPSGAAPTGPPILALDWSAPSRYQTIDVASRFDADLDGRPDPATLAELRAFVTPTAWPLELDACRSDLGGPGVTATWSWRTEIDGVWVPIGGDACRITATYPHEGEFAVEVSATTDAGSSTWTDVVRVNDILLVGLGDSYGSGEGNPDVEMGPGQRPVWSNPRCHRSGQADQSVAAHILEASDPRSSVTFVHLACSGAQISEPGWPDPAEGGVLSPYVGTRPELGTAPMPSQVDQLRLLLDGDDADEALDREVDAVVVSGGGNDMNFVPILTDCALPAAALGLAVVTPLAAPVALAPCYVPMDVPLVRTSAALLFDEGVVKLQRRLPMLGDALTDLGIPLDRVYQREYPDPTWSSPTTRCPTMLFGITIDEGTWASRTVLGALNRSIRQASEGRWHYVDGVDERYRDDGGVAHGECAGDDRWYRWPFESIGLQDDHLGTMHPNRAGHWAQGRLIADQLTHLLTQVPTPCIPSAQATLVDRPEGGWDVTDASTSPCGPTLAPVWSVNGRSAGTGRTITVRPDALVCGRATVSLTVSSRTGHIQRFLTILTGDPTVPASHSDRPGSVGTTTAESTSCDGGSTVARGTDSASTGWTDCLADRSAGVPPAPGPAPCPAGPRVGYARSEQADQGAQESLVVAADRRATPGDALDGFVESRATSAARYVVSAPDGGPVAAELRLRFAQSLRGESGPGCPVLEGPCAISGPPDPSDASGHAWLQGSLVASHEVVDPGCTDGCDPAVEQRDLATWTVDGSVDSCVSCTRLVDGVTTPLGDHRYAELRAVVSRAGDDGTWIDDDVTPFFADHTTATTWQADEVVVPLALADGDLLHTDHLAFVTGGAQGTAMLSAQQGIELEIVALTAGATIEPFVEDPPVVRADDVTVTERDLWWTEVAVPVRLSRPVDRPVTVDWSLKGGTAGSADVVDDRGTVTFVPGRTEGTIVVRVRNDLVDEPDETVSVVLEPTWGGAVAAGPATVTIVDDDDPPTLAIGDVWVDEGAVGLRPVRVPVTLSVPAVQDINFTWATEDGTAHDVADHWARGPVTSTIRAGQRTGVVTVLVVGDDVDEDDESFTVHLLGTSVPGVEVAGGPATVTIRGDEGQAGLRLGEVRAVEGHKGLRGVAVPATVTEAPTVDTPVTYRVVDDTTGDGDVAVRTRTVILRAGHTEVNLTAFVRGDLRPEGTERATVEVVDAGGLEVTKGRATVTITDDE